MPIDLSSRIAVVTGAGSGIGRGLAERLADAGAHVIAADVSEEGLRETAESIGADLCTIRNTDVSDPASFGSLADFVWSTFGRVDVLCNNAGVLGPQGDPLWDVPLDEWHRVLSVNFFGMLNGIRAFVPRMVGAARPAHIVNTASMEGFAPGPIVPQYGVSKHAAVALTDILRLQLEARDSPSTSPRSAPVRWPRASSQPNRRAWRTPPPAARTTGPGMRMRRGRSDGSPPMRWQTTSSTRSSTGDPTSSRILDPGSASRSAWNASGRCSRRPSGLARVRAARRFRHEPRQAPARTTAR